MPMSTGIRSRRRRKLLLATVAVDVIGTLLARARGYEIGLRTTVRCHRGHLFTTIWIPGVSAKALRLGWFRVQRCPVGRHWALVRPVRARDLSRRERRAAAVRDLPVP
jgi:hypothetical protein